MSGEQEIWSVEVGSFFSYLFLLECISFQGGFFDAGFIVEVDKVFIFLFLISLGTVALSSVAFAISAVIKNRSIAVVLFALHNLTSIVSVYIYVCVFMRRRASPV